MDNKQQTAKLHMIGNAHLDPVWLWQWQEGYAEIKATFRSALDRIKEFPDFIFTCACAAYYEWIEENAPDMFEEIRQRVAEGRWVIVGGWWIQPDCNLPSGESFARHGLISQRYFLEKFGVMANVGYNVDSFGHHGMLPQILKKSGLDYYVFQRPSPHEKQLTNSLFWWESEDGTRVLTFRLPTGYTDPGPARIEERLLNHEQMAKEEGYPLMSFYGVGNHGGGPTIAILRKLGELREKYGDELLMFSSPKAYFAEVERQEPLHIPVLKDDLQLHAIGCYSAHSETKALNRKAEHRLLTAEKFSAITHRLLAQPYPQERLNHAWKLVLFNHFHDVMGGCSIKEAYEDSRESFGEALNVSAVTLNHALQKISWSIDTMLPEVQSLSKENDWMLWEQQDLGIPLVVFNPLSWDVTVPIHVNKEVTSITDERRQPVTVQRIRASRTNGANDKWDTLFIGTIPAMGYRVYWIYKSKVLEGPNASALAATPTSLENDYVRVEFEPTSGAISKLWHKRLELDVFSGKGAVAQVIDEHDSDTWSHALRAFPNVIGQFTDAKLQVMEQGPLRATVRVTSRYNQSVLRQDFILHHDRPDIRVKVQLDWREKHKMLKLAFPVNVQQPEATSEIPYGFIVRPVDGEEKPGQQWVDVSEAGTGEQGTTTHGFALLNDSKYAYDVDGHVLRMTVARGAIFADHFAYHKGSRDEWNEYMDQGIQEFNYTLAPHAGSWQDAGIVKKAYELNVPPVSIVETYHRGSLPQSFDGIRISADSIVATAFKRAEDGQGYVLRCYETSGRQTETAIEIPSLDREWKAVFGKCEIMTFYIPDERAQSVRELNFIEM